MQIILLGTGTPVLDTARQQSALLVALDGKKLLFDAGRGVTSQVARAGIQPQQIDAVFVTHHHYDHISDLGEFLLTAWHNGPETPLNIYGPCGTVEIVAALLGQVYARDIAFTIFNIRPKSEAMMRSLTEDVRKDYGGKLIVGEDLTVIDVFE